MQQDSYYWQSVTAPRLAPSLVGQQKADLAIVGGGLTGLSAALEAQASGKSVVILEAERVGFGASGRNGGLLCPGFARSVSELRMDGESARGLWAMAIEARDLLHARRQAYDIDCDWQPGYFMAAAKRSHERDLQDYQQELAGLNYSETHYIQGGQVQDYVGSQVYTAGLFDPQGGHLHPLKYTLGLRAAVLAAGITLYEQSPVVAMEEQSGKVVLTTVKGQLEAKQVIVACNAYATGLLPKPETYILPVSTLIIGTEPLNADLALGLTPKRSAVDECYNILNYYHLSADNRMLFGGRSNYNGRMPRDIRAAVRPRMEHVYPQLQGVKLDFAWGGHVAITRQRFPHVGRTSERVYFAQGFSGQGLALTGQVGKVLAQALDGHDRGYDLFARIPHHVFPGGKRFRMPLQVMGMLYYRLQDML